MRWSIKGPFADPESSQDGEWFDELKDELLLPANGPSSTKVPVTKEDEADVRFANDEESRSARVLLSSSNKQRLVTGSIRFSGQQTPSHTELPPMLDKEEKKRRDYRVLLEKSRDGESKRIYRSGSGFVFSPDATCDVLLRHAGIIRSNESHRLSYSEQLAVELSEHPAGVIVLAGGTGTGKSTYARGLALRYLLAMGISRKNDLETKENPLSEYEPPHLVSFEDPIEGWTLDFETDSSVRTLNLMAHAESDLEAGIRLTCRAKGFDVDSLGSAYLHALRQKPDVVYIGECRTESDWNLAIELGGTGHLVITTCHASSLVDTFVKLGGVKSHEAQGRQQLASSLLAVVHLRRDNFNVEAFCKDRENAKLKFKPMQTYFTIWKRRPESVSNFVVDGLASLVVDEDNVISRCELARQIIQRQAGEHFDGGMLGQVIAGFRDESDFFNSLADFASNEAFRLDVGGL